MLMHVLVMSMYKCEGRRRDFCEWICVHGVYDMQITAASFVVCNRILCTTFKMHEKDEDDCLDSDGIYDDT